MRSGMAVGVIAVASELRASLTYVGRVLNEPVRGSLPESSLFSLSGIEQLRAYMRGHLPSTPLFRLLGCRVTQATSGTSVLSQPISPWFEINEGLVDLTATAEYSVHVTALSGAPPATHVRTVNLSLRFLRSCTLDDEAVTARGRVLHAGSGFTTVETVIEDALGRGVAHATGSVILTAMSPVPPVQTSPLGPIEEPVYGTADPPRRTIPVGYKSPLPPIGGFLGMRLGEGSDESVTVTMPTSEWFCRMYREVAPGIVALLANVAGTAALANVAGPGQRCAVLNVTSSFLAPVVPDGRALVATAAIRCRIDNSLVVDGEVTDADGRTVLVAQATCLVQPRRPRGGRRPADRVLLSVLFTDVVGSTEQVRKVGDTRWRELLDEHNTLVRRQLELQKGREVKTTGDGFLATFDSPTRAVQCARAIREGVTRLGLEIRAGIHTGECELVNGDVVGVAVHVASRVQSAAQPGEILVSSTVRDLIAGSGLVLVDRGVHELKGLEGTWTLLAVGDEA